MGKIYRGCYIKEEKKSWFKKKTIYGDLTVRAGSFIEAQHILCEKMNDYDVKICILLPICKEDEE